MNRRPLVIMAEQPPLHEKWEKYSAVCDDLDAQVELLRQKAVSIMEQKNKVKKTFWKDLAVDLKDKLPLDYTHEKYAMQFDDGVLYIMERKDAEKAVVEELPDFIKVLIHSLGEGNVVEHHIDDKPQTSETVH